MAWERQPRRVEGTRPNSTCSLFPRRPWEREVLDLHELLQRMIVPPLRLFAAGGGAADFGDVEAPFTVEPDVVRGEEVPRLARVLATAEPAEEPAARVENAYSASRRIFVRGRSTRPHSGPVTEFGY